MKEMQLYMEKFQKELNWQIQGESYEELKLSLLSNYMLLTTEVGEVAEELRELFSETQKNISNDNIEDTFALLKGKYKENIGDEISDCIAYLVKIAIFFNIDLEDAFYSKMDVVKNRMNNE